MHLILRRPGLVIRLRWLITSCLSIAPIIIWFTICYQSVGTPVNRLRALFFLSLGAEISRRLALPIVVRAFPGILIPRHGKSPTIQVRQKYRPVARSSAPSNIVFALQVLPAVSSSIIATLVGFSSPGTVIDASRVMPPVFEIVLGISIGTLGISMASGMVLDLGMASASATVWL